MKAKIMALMLAVGLGVTSIAVTAQAAEGKCTCANPSKQKVEDFASAYYWNGNLHRATYWVRFRCEICGLSTNDERYKTERLEPHDYEQIYFQDGSVMSYCTGCKDQFYW